jgi:hypothetical protein
MILELLVADVSLKDSLFMGFGVLLVSYLAYVRYYRYRLLNNMIKKYPDPNIVLENHDIAMEIYSDIFRKEFPRNDQSGSSKGSRTNLRL